MSNVLDLVAKITLDTTEYDKGLDDSKSKASGFGETVKNGFGKVAGAVGTLAKVTAAGIGAGSAAVGVLTKQAVGAYGEYEQLSGGVKKLFGDAYTSVMGFASEAYKTSGVSANQYMDQVTSFSAALINSLGGDTQKAAEMADVAMRGMSDNANTFGTDISSIQNAYQGFSKQNYTMLDNLKLGYGGTKTEMQRLVKDAEAMNTGFKAQRNEAGELTLAFSDVVQAIDLIQQKQGVAGTTAKEAATTIEGSLNMVKGAWENLVAGFANPDADMDQLMNNLIVSIVGENEGEGLLNQLIPAVQRALEGIGQFLVEAAPIIGEQLPGMIEAIVPSLLEAATSLMGSLVTALPEILQILIEQIPTIITTLSEAVMEAFPMFIELGQAIATTLFEAVGEPGALAEKVLGIVESFLTFIENNLPLIVEEGTRLLDNLGQGFVTGIPKFLQNLLPMITQFTGKLRENAGKIVDAGMKLILNLAEGIAKSIPTLVQQIPQIVINIAGIINDNLPKILATGVQILVTLGKGIIDAIPTIVENIPKIIEAIVAVWQAFNWLDLGKNVIELIGNGITMLRENLPGFLKEIGENAFEFFKSVDWAGLGSSVITFIGDGVNMLFTSIPDLLGSIGEAAINLVTSIDWLGLGSSIITFIGNGIMALISHIPDILGIVAQGALDVFNSIDWAGIGSGIINFLADGIHSMIDAPVNFVKGMVDDLLNIMDFDWSLPDIQLPHLSVTWEDLGPISIPHVSVEWYAKAYDNPYLFTQPTVMGAYGFGDRPGGEIVYGHENLMDDIRDAMQSPVILTAIQKIPEIIKSAVETVTKGQNSIASMIGSSANAISGIIKNAVGAVTNSQNALSNLINTFFNGLSGILENAFEKQDAILESLHDSMGMANGVLGRTYAIENFYSGPHEVYTEEVSLGELMVKIFDEIEDIGFDVHVILRHLYGGLGGFHEAIREDLQSFAPQIVLDTGKLVGELAPAMDSSLGVISARKGRYN